jgi:hypothetical protein
MNEINGQFGGKKVFEILLDSGELVHVQPLSIYVVRALENKAQEIYPFPDKAEYEKPLDDAKALEPGQKIPAEENPDYQKAYTNATKLQARYSNERCFMLSIEPVVGREKLIAKYKTRIAQMREMMTLPDDDWEATLRFCVLTSSEDYIRVTAAIQGGAEVVSEEEIRDGMRIFRCYVRHNPDRGCYPDQEPQSADAQDAPKAQHSI